MSQPLPPFTCASSVGFSKMLFDLNCTLAITTYQAGKVIFISAPDKSKLIQLPRNFKKPMGLTFFENQMLVASKTEVSVYYNAHQLAKNYPEQPNTYDSLFLPRTTYHTGEIDTHDVFVVDNEVGCVNTLFSCLAKFDSKHSFKPFWKPFFITELAPEDRCHLNGVALQNNRPVYITALAQTNEPRGWRKQKKDGGILLDIEKNTIVAEGLSMPHSPRIYRNSVLLLSSGTGELIEVKNGNKEVICSFDGYTRGLEVSGEFAFVGLSKIRKSSKGFQELPISQHKTYCGVDIVHLPSRKIVESLRYQNSVEEIYDIRILDGFRRPGLLTPEKNGHAIAITTTSGDFWTKSDEE